jgi:cyclase
MIRRTRVIPVLLIHKGAVYKTIKFNSPQYIGDPKNAIRLFNDLEVDEIVILDIDASKKNNSPNIQLIKELASEAFMPFSYGGGIKNIKHVKNILKCGVEKVILNHSIIQDVTLLKSISNEIGSSGVVASVDYLNKWGNRQFLFDHVTKKKYRINMLEHIKKLQNYGAGEIILNCVNNDGLMDGLDIETLKQIHESSDVPLIACGGAGTISNLKDAESAGASGIAAGSMFVYFGKQKGILINYPKETSLRDNLR